MQADQPIQIALKPSTPQLGPLWRVEALLGPNFCLTLQAPQAWKISARNLGGSNKGDAITLEAPLNGRLDEIAVIFRYRESLDSTDLSYRVLIIDPSDETIKRDFSGTVLDPIGEHFTRNLEEALRDEREFFGIQLPLISIYSSLK